MIKNVQPLLQATAVGLYCERGGFYIDPWRPVDRAIVTHAHADHLCRGCGNYLIAHGGLGVTRMRLDEDAAITTTSYGEPIEINGVRVSLHPAGHILGSAQVRLEHEGRIWVVSGDYKVDPDLTCGRLSRFAAMSSLASARSVCRFIDGLPSKMSLRKSSLGGKATKRPAERACFMDTHWASRNVCLPAWQQPLSNAEACLAQFTPMAQLRQ